MADQTQRLEVATVRAEVGSSILYRFSNDAVDAAVIPTESGNINNLKKVILDIQTEGAEKISFATTIYPTTAAGIAATTDGAIFLVASSDADEIYAVYSNNAGTAVDTGKRAISGAAVTAAVDTATTAAANAQTAADTATARVAGFHSPTASDPTTRDDGTALQIGDTYFNTTLQSTQIYTSTGWAAQALDANYLSANTGATRVGTSAGITVQATLTNINAALSGSIPGSAAKLTTPRSISATGDATWTTSFDGSANSTGALTLADTGVTPGTGVRVTVDSKGRVTAVQTSALAVTNGGTGVTSIPLLRAALSINNVDNTPDANKPVSTAQQTALNLKTDSSSLALTTDTTKGAALVGYRGRTLHQRLDDVLNVKDYGAVGDGVTDDYPEIQAVLTAAAASSRFNAVFLPAGSYRVSAGLTIPAGVTLYSEAGGEGYNGTTVSGGAEIVADLSVATIVTIDGGSASAACNMRRILVRRAAGTVPAGSIGVKTINTDDCIIEDVVSTRSAIGFSIEGQLAVTLQNCNTFAVTDTHLQLKNVVEVTCISCRFGRNGGADLATTSYVRLTGAVDTISFIRCQFNQSGAFVAGPILDFTSYNSPNGIITLDGCHAESFNGPLLLQQGAGSSSIQRITVSSSQIHSDAATRELISGLTGLIDQLMIVGNASIVGKITLDQQTKWTISDNFIQGAILINSGSGVFANNKLNSTLSIQGSFPDGTNTCAVVCGNALVGGGAFTNTATGNILVFGNVVNTVAANATGINSIGGGYLQMAGPAFAVQRFTGTLNSSGAITLTLPTTSMSNANLKVMSASAWYKGGSGEARPLVVGYIDGSTISVTGGTASVRYRISIIYTQDNDVW